MRVPALVPPRFLTAGDGPFDLRVGAFAERATLLARAADLDCRAAGWREAVLRVAGLRAAGLRVAGLRVAVLRVAGLREAVLRAAGLRAVALRAAVDARVDAFFFLLITSSPHRVVEGADARTDASERTGPRA